MKWYHIHWKESRFYSGKTKHGLKKSQIWPVIISIFIHVTLLAVTGVIDLRDNIKPVGIFSVSITEPEQEEKPRA